MTTMHLEDGALERYFDGDLAGSEADQVRTHVDTCDACKKELRSLERLRQMFALTAEDAGASLELDALYGRVRAGVEKQKNAGFGEKLRLIVGDVMEDKRRAIVPAALLAAAAALLVVVKMSGGATEEVAHREPTPVTPQTVAQVVQTTLRGGSEILEVDFGDNTGTVFEVASQGGASAAVVWINDEPAEGP